MKTIYTKDNCPACVQLKQKLKREGHDFEEIVIGKDITREDFIVAFPGVKSVPYTVENTEGGSDAHSM